MRPVRRMRSPPSARDKNEHPQQDPPRTTAGAQAEGGLRILSVDVALTAADLAERRCTAHPPVLSNARCGPSGTGGVCAVRRHPKGPSAEPNEAVDIERSEDSAKSEETVDSYGPEAFDASDCPEEPTPIQMSPAHTPTAGDARFGLSHIARQEGRRLTPRISRLGLRRDRRAVQLVCAAGVAIRRCFT